MSTLINPQRPAPQASADFNAQPIYLRNPETGVVFKLFHKDSIARCLRERYEPATEAEMRAQAVELAELQGRPLPPWAQPEQLPAEPEQPADPESATPYGPPHGSVRPAAGRGR